MAPSPSKPQHRPKTQRPKIPARLSIGRTPEPAASHRTRLLGLAALSGSCGLAWEILYARLFANVFGNGFMVTGLVLASVFLGMALGAWFSGRLLRHLAVIEIVIGLWSAITSLGLGLWGLEGLAHVPAGGLHNVILMALLVPPMAMIGSCVPLFSRAVGLSPSQGRDGFMRVYGLYNLGAFVSVLLIEFALMRWLGLMVTGALVACLNLVVGTGVAWTTLQATGAGLGVPQKTRAITRQAAQGQSAPLNRDIAAALVLASFASGVFQLLVLKLSFRIYGPLQENFAILLAAAILGVAAGTGLARRRNPSMPAVLSMALMAVLLFLLTARLMVYGWGWVHELPLSDTVLTLGKMLLLGAPAFGVFTVFGMLVPVAVSAHLKSPQNGADPTLSGRLLALSSLGNGLGALVMFLWLYKTMSMPAIFGLLLVVLLLGWAILRRSPALWHGKAHEARRGSHFFGSTIVGGVLLSAGLTLWPATALLLGYKTLESAELTRQQNRQVTQAEVYKAYDQDASLVDFDDGSRALILNGYRSLTFGPGARAPLHEVIVGSTPALFSKSVDSALVLGLGSGITAGATARLYAHTRVVEINPAMFKIPGHFAAENAQLMQRETAEIVLEDGVSRLISEDNHYDAIINTVTSPRYYSASKLYTRDFYDLVKKRLSHGGVYSSWFDLSISLDGIAVMLNTLEASFDACRYFVLSSGYFNVVCAEEALLYQSSQKIALRMESTGIASVFADHGLPLRAPDALRQLEISFGPKFLSRTSNDLNTLDRPVIELLPISPARLAAASDVLAQTLVANIEYQRQTAFGRNDWRRACKTIAWMALLDLTGC